MISAEMFVGLLVGLTVKLIQERLQRARQGGERPLRVSRYVYWYRALNDLVWVAKKWPE